MNTKTNIFLTIFLTLYVQTLFSQIDSCARITNFGQVELCLPNMEGMKESYLESKVKTLADATEVPSNVVLGFYLDDDTYNIKDQLGEFSLNNYCKIYGTKEIQNVKVNTEILNTINTMMGSNFITENWEEMKQEIDKIDSDIEVNVPTVIKKYEYNEESFTYVMLTKYEINEDNSYTLAMTINGMLLKERLVWMAYYLLYEDEKTILRLEEKTNTVIDRFFKNNK